MISKTIPSFDEHLAFLDLFICQLVDDYKAGKIRSWKELEISVKEFFTPQVMDRTIEVVPHWGKMTSYMDGFTLTHVMCVFLGLYMMPEFLGMTSEQQQIMKWVILFHDVEKELQPGKRDHFHAYRSTVGAAKGLPDLGFPVLPEYTTIFNEWSDLTLSAKTTLDDSSFEVEDHQKLPHILTGIERMFGQDTPAALILKTILFHLSVPTNDWPPPNPLTEEEILRYFDLELLPCLKVMNLGDSEGWALFNPEVRERQRLDTVQVFDRLERLISQHT